MSSSRLAVGVLGVVLLGVGITSYFLRRSESSRSGDRPQRVAVLPFENQSGADAYDGIDQLAALTVSRQLQTLPKVSVFIARTANEAVSLGATYIVYMCAACDATRVKAAASSSFLKGPMDWAWMKIGTPAFWAMRSGSRWLSSERCPYSEQKTSPPEATTASAVSSSRSVA